VHEADSVENYWNLVQMCLGNLLEVSLVGFVDTLEIGSEVTTGSEKQGC